MRYTFWNIEELTILKNKWSSSQMEDMVKLFPNRNESSIYNKAKKLGLIKDTSFKTKKRPKKNKMDVEKFIERAKDIHGYKYDYSHVEIIDGTLQVSIKCNAHNIIFQQNPYIHLNGSGCPKCANNVRLSKTEFIEKAIKIHGNKYDYINVIYKNNNTPIIIICPVHGEFMQRPADHTDGKNGCNKCYSESKPLGNEYFINQAKIIHSETYLYDLVEYKNKRSKVKIICKKHGVFEQNPESHLIGQGCPICKSSLGETIIHLLLTENNIQFIKEKKFNDCKLKGLLKFDFYLSEYNYIIEYDGVQHFKEIKYYGGKSGLVIIKKRDRLKNKYCKQNGIYLLRIRYTDDIVKKLERFFIKILGVELKTNTGIIELNNILIKKVIHAEKYI